MKEVVDKVSKRWMRVEVTEPVTITTKSNLGFTKSYTSYLIRIENNHWAFSLNHSEVRRRYSEFCWLRSKLRVHHPNKIVPPLPPKHLLHITNFDPLLIEERGNGLEKFLQRVLRSFVFLSDAALHLFLQSNLTIPEIEEKLVEEIKPKFNYTKGMAPSSLTENINIIKPKAHIMEFSGSCNSCSSTSSDSSITSVDVEEEEDEDDCDQAESSSTGGGLSDSEEKELDDEQVHTEFNVLPPYAQIQSLMSSVRL